MEWVVEERSLWHYQHFKKRELLVMCSVFALRYVFKTHTFALRYMRYRYIRLIHQFLLSFLYNIL